MKRPAWRLFRQALAGWLVGVAALAAILALIGFGPVRGWRRNAALVAEGRASERAELLALAFARDMRGVQDTILAQAAPGEADSRASDLTDLVADAFARYPYAETFFAGGGSDSPDAIQFFVRTARSPSWIRDARASFPFPVVVVANADVGQRLADRIRPDVLAGRRFSVFDLRVGDTPYQVVARITYRDAYREEPVAVFGFMANLAWVRTHYFRDVADQVSRIGDTRTAVAVSIFDARGGAIVGGPRTNDGGPMIRRELPLLFFDPRLVAVDLPRDLARDTLTIEVSASQDPGLRTANRAAVTTLTMVCAAGLALILGVSMTARAAHASAALAQVRSEFVASVTHELKTPIATIRAIGDALTSGRMAGPAAVPRYGQLVTNEAKRLGRLVDNVLASSRITDVADVYSFEALPIAEIVEDVVRDLGTVIAEKGFEVTVTIPPDVPAVRGDRLALHLVVDNLLDNAVKYSAATRSIRIGASYEPPMVTLTVRDRGVGIAAGEIDHVTRRFYRGKAAPSGGNGLGLAIVAKIVGDHDGVLTIDSVEGEGTTVSVSVRAAEPNV
ncbi:MAG TPA: HAMP domain-containing sensor histidine kinase [Vicinamibacterales bacterium]|nr:HAMP domain-containing sensor histidine kinase [Vicinamibacterales bacterium]